MATEPKHAFDPEVERYLANMVVKDEWSVGELNRKQENREFSTIVDMFEGKRAVKDYEWYSNVSLKEATSILLTDASSSVNQYFQTRDFVEVYLEGDGPDDDKKCKATRKTINKILNNRRLYHYQKFTRAKNINNMASHVYILCRWEQDIVNKQVGVTGAWIEAGFDPKTGTTKWDFNETPVMEPNIKVDQFNYDVLDPRNCAVSDEYTYSVQEKRWFIYRTETSYEELKAEEVKQGYVNLDLVKPLVVPTQTEASRARGETKEKPKKSPVRPLDKYVRFGKIWAIVEGRDEDDIPISIKPGYDENGNVKADAELVEAIVVFASNGTTHIPVKFSPTPFIDSRGNPYKPVCRGICYPHPTKDTGLGDGELLLDINGAVDDAFCLAFDRSKVATIPTLIGDKFAVEDNETIFVEPGHTIAVEGGRKSLEPLKIDGDVSGILNMMATALNKTEQVTATYPTTMGNLGSIAASTTATAIAGADLRTNARTNYKSLTMEYTLLTDFYWMILQMTYRFAHPRTAVRLMGEDVYFFDPDAEYTYTPVTSAIETEFNKFRKMQQIQQLMATVAPIPNPSTPKVLNILLGMLYDLLGPDFVKLQKAEFDTSPAAQQLAIQGAGGQANQPAITTPMSNQSGTPQSTGEMDARSRMYQMRNMG
jgi:hypothetical protein